MAGILYRVPSMDNHTATADLSETMSVHASLKIPRQMFADVLCTAVEGGSNFWAIFWRAVQTDTGDYVAVFVEEREESSDDQPRRQIVITHDDLARALVLALSLPWAVRHARDFLSENHDAETADVLLQLAVFGELVYG